MCALGSELVLTDPTKGMVGTIKKASELFKKTPNGFMLQQFENPMKIKVY